MNNKPRFPDVLILSCFVVFITFQPYLFHHEIIMMETGIHLPGIQAFAHGAVPYKDFFYLRGPLEFYVPALLMKTFGYNMIWLPVFYFVSTVLTMVLVVVLAAQLYRTRLILYLMVPVFAARTFPRISFYYWGGMRYALGILALIFAVQSFKSKRALGMFAAGMVSCLAFWTTIEAGAATIMAIGGALLATFVFKLDDRRFITGLFVNYIFGILMLLIPGVLVMAVRGSLVPYVQMTYTVLTKMCLTFINGPGMHPEGAGGFFRALFPGSKFFKSMTPIYFYLILFGYIVYRRKKKSSCPEIPPLITIAFYGIILFFAAFRRLDGHHFEMALQPEKILYFFILEEIYLWFLKKRLMEKERIKGLLLNGWRYFSERKKIYLINFLIFSLIGSSLGYSFKRYQKRFVMPKYLENKLGLRHDRDLSFLHEVEKRPVDIKRAKGMVVPAWQADEMEGIVRFLKNKTRPGETVFAYPEIANFNFWADRPFVGRFPIATFSWMDENWHKEMIADFKRIQPRYVIMTNLGHRTFPKEWYFRNKSNIKKFNEMTELILDNYDVIKTYESVSLYEHK